jgi:hypothetical protein
MPIGAMHDCPYCQCHPPHRPIKTDTGRWFKSTVEMPGATELQAEAVASRLNQHIPIRTRRGGRYRVLNHYPSGKLYVTLTECGR